MNIAMQELAAGLYGLALFTLGLAIAVRVSSHRASVLRGRMLALAAFGILHALSEWGYLAELIAGEPVLPHLNSAVEALSFLALFYFALGGLDRAKPIFLAIAGVFVTVFLVVALAGAEPRHLQLVVPLGMGIPAALATAVAFVRDPSLRIQRDGRRRAQWAAAFGFAAYGLSQFVSEPAARFLASWFDVAGLQAAVGVPIVLARTEIALLIAGAILWLLATFEALLRQDLEERANTANAALMARENQLAEAQRIAQVGSWDLDLMADTSDWSPEVYRILELDPARGPMCPEAFLDLVHPEDRAEVNRAFMASLREGAPHDTTYRIPMADSRTKWVETRGEITFDATGRPALLRGTIHDVTHRRNTEGALRQRETMLAAFLEASPEAVIVTDDEGRVTVFSAGAEAIYGYRSAEVVGRPVECLIPARLREAHRKHRRAFADRPAIGPTTTISMRNEVIGLRRNGEEFPAEASVSKLTTPEGTFFAAILRDVTRQNAASEELLEAKIAAEAASEAKSRFIANMSHELRTPLNAIIGFSDILVHSADFRLSEAKTREYATDIRDSGHRLLSTINDILEISRMEFGNPELTNETIAVADLVRSCVRTIHRRAAECGIEVQADVATDLPDLWADSRLLVQATLNLLSNAVKFTESGGRVVISAARSRQGGIDLSIRDTGIGIKPKDVGRINEPFMQADSTLARRYEGTGLGLTIVKRIVELHEGDLAIESTLGAGTVATISLPARRLGPSRTAAA